MLKYFMRVKSTNVLGFGNRCAIWTSGCSKQPPCKGCLLNQHHSTPEKSTTVTEITDWILSCSSATGITLSGGEPFDQATALADIIENVKNHKDDNYSVVIYTGRLYEDLLELSETNNSVGRLLSLTDILIDGPYIEELDDNIPFRGSSNQRILVLNERFAQEAANYYSDVPGRKVEFTVSEGETLLVGVPSKNQLSGWKTLIENNA